MYVNSWHLQGLPHIAECQVKGLSVLAIGPVQLGSPGNGIVPFRMRGNVQPLVVGGQTYHLVLVALGFYGVKVFGLRVHRFSFRLVVFVAYH